LSNPESKATGIADAPHPSRDDFPLIQSVDTAIFARIDKIVAKSVT
jgi:hypothetical protein